MATMSETKITLPEAAEIWAGDLQQTAVRNHEIKSNMQANRYNTKHRESDNAVYWTMYLNTACQKCHSNTFWTFALEPILWRCICCHPVDTEIRKVEKYIRLLYCPAERALRLHKVDIKSKLATCRKCGNQKEWLKDGEKWNSN